MGTGSDRHGGGELGGGTRETGTTGTVVSRDGTPIAYERVGAGPALIAVDAAGSYGAFRPLRPPVEPLAERFTVYLYDRRGRGGSGDTQPYAIEREVEDLAALVEEAGGSAFLYGMSSGSLLALHAAASGLAVPRVALFEPPFDPDEPPAGETPFTAELAKLVEAGRHHDAVAFFHQDILPEEVMAQTSPETWAALEAIAPTLVYDARLSDRTTLQVVRSVTVPTLVIDSQGSDGELGAMAASVAGALPDGSARSLAGDWHVVPGAMLAPVLTEFFLAGNR